MFSPVLGGTPKVFPLGWGDAILSLFSALQRTQNGSLIRKRVGAPQPTPGCGFYSTFPTVTCTERLNANPSERKPWQRTWRELTITGFLRVGLRCIYLPNASSKEIPNTAFSFKSLPF
jgi:hypothetical protein